MLVETHLLTKRYGGFTALDDCDLQVQAGEVFGLLGPNGAGKTTLIRLLLGFLRPSSGWARIDGLDCFHRSVEVRRHLAYLPAEAKLFRRMRAKEVLSFFADVRRSPGQLDRAVALAERLDLDLTRRVAFMSTGMRQKLALAATMSHDTPLMILDEPTANLDPNVRHEVMTIVTELRTAGHTVLVSSHVLPEIEQSCDRVVILRDGRIVHTQDLHQLRRRHRVTARATAKLSKVPEQVAERLAVRQESEKVTIETEGDLKDFLPWISTQPLENIAIEPFGLRSVYDHYHREDAVE